MSVNQMVALVGGTMSKKVMAWVMAAEAAIDEYAMQVSDLRCELSHMAAVIEKALTEYETHNEWEPVRIILTAAIRDR